MTALRELARLYGVQTRYLDTRGRQPQASPDVLVAVLGALGAPVTSERDAVDALATRHRELGARLIEPVIVAWDGVFPATDIGPPGSDAPARVELHLEEGACELLEVAPTDRDTMQVHHPGRLPAGDHLLLVERGPVQQPAHVISAPRRVWWPDGPRRKGVFAPLHALHSGQSIDAGNLTDLGSLGAWVGDLGGSLVGTLPLLAAFLDPPAEPSPYSPVSRLMWNELYLDLHRVPEVQMDGAGGEREPRRFVDHEAQAALQRRLLEPVAVELGRRSPARHRQMQEFLDARPDVVDYARFRAAGERHGRDWRRWPAPGTSGDLEALDLDPDSVAYHAYVQWLATEQMGQLEGRLGSSGSSLYLDLPLGVHPNGWDAWRHRDQLVEELSVGAPPDPLFAGGQNWGFAPLHPTGSRLAGHGYFRSCLAHHAAAAGVLRLDHVMGLHRLFCIPAGGDEGVYVRQPHDELWATVCLESHRHQCGIVGENLGTVPKAVDTAMRAHGAAGMWVAQFDPVGEPEPGWLACVNTHDTPTFAGWWRDLDESARDRVRDRLRRDVGLAGDDEASVLHSLLGLLARSDAGIVMVTLEDLWLEPEPQNMPGTTDEYPNWTRRMQLDLETICSEPGINDLLRDLLEGATPP